ncbi:helix-turn-helix domain-containing protein [Campylobacter concisus]|uniref:Helix-turn-helix domain-containing protein n=1 Tax=Campylobacter concisus TaxID=199 RepID=A0A1Y5MT68_9BACT|nr:helix-turn-helix domain-containing protein [Campylobacter concisus]OUT11587.1 helix-turn-helix domain-containing protein [Campylobacter concisus]
MSEIAALSEAVGFIPSKYAREILNISKPTLKKLIDAGIIKANKINQRVIYCDLASIKEYMSGQRA